MREWLIDQFDTALHTAFDDYIDSQRLGWGLLQLAQWHVCQRVVTGPYE